MLDKEPELRYVKGKETLGLNGQFAGWSPQERDDRLLEFVPAIAKRSTRGIAFVIDNRRALCFQNTIATVAHERPTV